MGCGVSSSKDEVGEPEQPQSPATPVKSSKKDNGENVGKSPNGQPKWTAETASKLQEAVDRVFGTGGAFLLGLEFSFSIADPFLEGCPLIGCSSGFTKLCGYDLKDIVGRNCRFLVDPVPAHEIDDSLRGHTKKFCEAVRLGQDYKIPAIASEAWMPVGRQGSELFAMQKNARKDGTFFNNMFYMKAVDLGEELGKERPYIVALQSELPDGKNDLAKLVQNIEQLDSKMMQVEKALAISFFLRSSISRQLHSTLPSNPATLVVDTQANGSLAQPQKLHESFQPAQVQPWSSGRFKEVKVLAQAVRNRGVVRLMKDLNNAQLVAVKQMPNTWVQTSHETFISKYPAETEYPWQDIGCMKFLESQNFKHVCRLEGVYRDTTHTFVVSAYATEGDLFSTATADDSVALGPAREQAFAPLVLELLSAMKQLHEMQIVHRDLSLENVLCTKGEDGSISLKLIDFGMASCDRMFTKCKRGKPSYQAPEMQEDATYDAFLTDVFAAGVMVFALCLKDYPWQSTKPGQCKCFDFVTKKGFRQYCKQRQVRGTKKMITECLSEALLDMLEGMLASDPANRLTLGESQWGNSRKSVWDELWMSNRSKAL